MVRLFSSGVVEAPWKLRAGVGPAGVGEGATMLARVRLFFPSGKTFAWTHLTTWQSRMKKSQHGSNSMHVSSYYISIADFTEASIIAPQTTSAPISPSPGRRNTGSTFQLD